MQRLYRSLFLIVLLNVGGYFLANLYLVLCVFGVFSFDPIQEWNISHFAGALINGAALSNGIILYCNRLVNVTHLQ